MKVIKIIFIILLISVSCFGENHDFPNDSGQRYSAPDSDKLVLNRETLCNLGLDPNTVLILTHASDTADMEGVSRAATQDIIKFAKEQNKINQVTISNKNSVGLAWKFISGIIFSLVATIGIIITTIVIGI